MDKNRIVRKSKKVKTKRPRRRVFNHAALTTAQWEVVETLAAQPRNGIPLAERIGKLLNSKPIPFDGSLPIGSGDESSEATRLGLPPEA